MNMRTSSEALATMKFGVGQSVPRNEDPVLVRGEGRYTDDLSLEGQLYAAFVRSPHAHGVIRGIDVSDAKSMKGVVAIYTGLDLEGHGYGPLKCQIDLPSRDGTPMKRPVRQALATDKVRFVGDPVAMVVARTAVQARDAAEAVALDIEILPAVTRGRMRSRPARRSSMTTSRAMSSSTTITAMPKRSLPPLPAPPTSRSCASSTTASW